MNAQQKFRPNSATIKILGTSKIGIMTSETNQGFIDLSENIDTVLLKSISALKVTILMKTIKSSQGSVIDRNTYNALGADEDTLIVYIL